MNVEHFEIKDGYACFRPIGDATPQSLLALLEPVMAVCQTNQIRKLLVDITRLRHEPLTTTDRYDFANGLAAFWDRSIRITALLRPDQIDPDRFGILVARNRGLILGAETSEAKALEWLKSQ